jgi:polyisoprenoid-binding protein YceI
MLPLITRPARLFLLSAAIGLVLLAARAPAADAPPAVAAIRFSGSSTLHDFAGHATSEVFAAAVREDPATGRTLLSATVRVPLAGASTDHAARDLKMCRMFDTGHYPVAEGILSDAPVPASGSGPVELVLRLHGREHTLGATLSGWRTDGGTSSFRLDFPVSLRAFGLEPPSVLGMIRVADTVRVECSIAPAGGTAAGGGGA